MDESITEHMYESRGYDRGFTAGTLHCHELVNEYINKIQTQPLEPMIKSNMIMQLEEIKLLFRKGYIDE